MSVNEPASQHAGKLARLKHFLHKESDSPAASLASNSTSNDDLNALTRGASIDSTLDRLTPTSRTSSENQRASSDVARRSLSKLVPSKFKRRPSTQDIDLRTDSNASGASSQPDLRLSSPVDSRRSSLVTDASDLDIQPARPTVSTHNSHKGLLTQSSPLLKIETTSAIPETSISKPDPSPSPGPPSAKTKSPAPLSFDSPSEYHFCVTAPTPTDSVSPEVNWPRAQDDDKHDLIQASGSTTPSKRRLSLQTDPTTPPGPNHTPTTVVTPPTPTSHAQKIFNDDKAPPFRHRKSASVGSSKLAHTTGVDDPTSLTPPLEEQRTPGGSLTAPTPSSSFFSGFISAAQNAASHLGTSIQGKRSVSSLQDTPQLATASTTSLPQDLTMNQPRSQRSATTNLDNAATVGGAATTRPRSMTSPTEPSVGDEKEPARPVSASQDKPAAPAVQAPRPPSLTSQNSLQLEHAQTLPTEHSPSRTSSGLVEPSTGVKRSGSVRSKLSRRRHRGSSAGTGGTLAAALTASTIVATHPGAGTSINGHRHTGFAVASTKRNKEFHQLFRSVPEDDYLIEDYSAALQKDILLQGRFYVSEGHICFMSNILGWVTNLVIAFDEIVSIEKKNTAIVFPNALSIATHQARSTFASFVTRDSTYDLLLAIWKTSQPNLQISTHGVMLLDHGVPDKKGTPPADDSSSEVSDDVYDEDEDEEDSGSFADPGNGSIAGSDIHEGTISRKPSVAAVSIAPTAGPKSPEVDSTVTTSPAAEFPGSSTHAPTECADQGSHYDKQLVDTTINAPIGKVYNLWFGPSSGVFMRKWLVDDQKSRDLVYEDDKTGLDATHKTFTFQYVKPLSGPVGPKQTRCIVTNTVTAFDLDKAISIDASTQTPDVPSGGIFTVKTRYCLMWGPNNSTRIIASCAIEWSGKSWLKGPIESGANAGQLAYVNDLVTALRAATSTGGVKAGPRKGKTRRRKDITLTTDMGESSAVPHPAQVSSTTDWGIFEPIHGVLRPVLSLVSPFLTSQVVIAVLFVLLMQAWFWRKSANTALDSTARYEAIWRAEENDLWDWLETRIGTDAVDSQIDSMAGKRQAVLASRAAKRTIDDAKMSQRQVEVAIRITEKRLGVLKEAVARKKS